MGYSPNFNLFILTVLMLLFSSCSTISPDGSVMPVNTMDPTGLQPSGVVLSTQYGDKNQIQHLSAGEQQVVGVVLSGGDQTPEGLMGGPRIFAYQVQLDSGEVITVEYTAYPPSPAGDSEPRPRLNFHAGTIKLGDRLIAQGTYDPTKETLTIEAETDFIETFIK